MIVVADSGPLSYLILLDQAELLHRFYGEVIVPEAVIRELRARGSPATGERLPLNSTCMAKAKRDVDRSRATRTARTG